jgi:hypothetical protein
LNARDAESDGYREFCVNGSPGASTHQPDYNEMTDDLDEMLQVLSTKERMLAARERGLVGTPFEALVRDVNIMAQRIFEKSIGRNAK